MISYYRYTDKELQTLLKSMVIVIDSREQENGHIIKWLNEKKFPYVTQKIETGDYGFFLPANSEMGMVRDLYFTDKIVVERKNSIEELSGTFSDRDRFESELLRAKDKQFILMVEESQGYEKIINHRYSTQYNEKSFLATLFTFRHRYGMDINFIDKRYAGLFIYQQFYYFLREFLKS
jgi:ERCC4-type nuclease